MEDKVDLVPVETGADGTQEAEGPHQSDGSPRFVARGRFQDQFAGTIRTVTEQSSRAFGGAVAGMFAQGWAAEIAQERSELRDEVRMLRDKVSRLQEDLSKAGVENARLSTRHDMLEGIKHLRHLGIAFGTAMASVGVDKAFASSLAAGLALIGGGSVIVVGSWLAPIRRGKN